MKWKRHRNQLKERIVEKETTRVVIRRNWLYNTFQVPTLLHEVKKTHSGNWRNAEFLKVDPRNDIEYI